MEEEEAPQEEPEEALERPIRLHDLRLDAVKDEILAAGARTVTVDFCSPPQPPTFCRWAFHDGL